MNVLILAHAHNIVLMRNMVLLVVVMQIMCCQLTNEHVKLHKIVRKCVYMFQTEIVYTGLTVH
jgi:hypothetical protein